MNEVLNQFLIPFYALFLAIDAIGVAPIFISLTSKMSEPRRMLMANRGVFTTFIILSFFALTGALILDLFGISLSAFRIGGGILLLILSIDMVMSRPNSPLQSSSEDSHKEDISVFPMAIPLLSGPASITMLILFMKEAHGHFVHQLMIMLALIANMFICWLIFRFSSQISKKLGKTGINVITRIFGILLTALACQFFIDGVRGAFMLK